MTPRLASLVLAAAALGLAGAARAGDPRALLAQAVAQAGAPRTLRAEVRIERDGAPAIDAVVLERGRRRYVETRDGTRALLAPGKTATVRGGRVVPAATGATLGGSDILLEDLAPFGPRSLTMPQVSDDGPAGMVVTGAPPPPTAYVLVVHTIDPERAVIVKTKYYRDTINNLVKMIRQDDFTSLGDRWRPGAVGVETFGPQARTTTMRLRWREAPDTPPALFTPAGLRAPSPITWP